jgi:peptidoglycan/xylan/chitin deacetylase (PgdA/CDA1 family)
VILEPNRRRRQRAFRAVAGLVVVLFIGGLLATGWTPPAFSIAIATPTAPPAASPTNAVAVVPTSSPEPSVLPSQSPPAPTPGADGCIPPSPDIVPATVASHGSRTDKVVALSFDDGNDSENTQKILYILKSRGVNATFFPTARAVELAPKTWQQVANAGYPIANHTYHHFSLKGLCFEKQLAELNKAKSVIAAQPLPMQGYMRPPYEEFDENTRLAASAAGETYVVLWDIDTFDWTGVSWRTIASRALQGRSGSIILMHTSARASSTALYEIIKQFKKRGYRFATVGQMLGIPGPVPIP